MAEKPSAEHAVAAVSRTQVSTMGESAAVVFDDGAGGEVSFRIPFEVIPDLQAALGHAQRALVFRRNALGSGETPNLFHVQSVRALDLPDGQLHLQVSAENGISFHFHVSTAMAGRLAEALGAWLAERGAAGK